MPARQRFLFTRREDWKSRALLPVDTYIAFRFFTKSELKIQLFLCYTRYVDNVSLSPKSGIFDMPTWQHFLNFTQRGDWKKSRLLLPVNVYLAFRGFFLKSELINQLFFHHSIRWPWFHLSQERIENPALTVFSLRYADRLLFPQSGWTDPALHSFSRYSKRRQCLLFCDSTRLFMWSVLWFSHFVPSALVCVSNPVPKGIFRLFCRLTFKQEALHA